MSDLCSTCEVKDYGNGTLVPIWVPPGGREKGLPPDYIGCTECLTMTEYNPDDGGP